MVRLSHFKVEHWISGLPERSNRFDQPPDEPVDMQSHHNDGFEGSRIPKFPPELATPLPSVCNLKAGHLGHLLSVGLGATSTADETDRGSSPTENGNRRLHPLPRTDSVLPIGSASPAAGPVAPRRGLWARPEETVEGPTLRASAFLKLSLRNFFRYLHAVKIRTLLFAFKG